MRKNSIAIISLAFLASCFMVSCSTEAFDTNQPVKGAKIVIPAQKMSTKAVDAAGKATFLKSENVYIAKSGTIDANVIHPTDNAASTTLTGTLAGTYSQGDMITVLYNTSASGVVDYSGQDGSIGSVKDAGYAEDIEIVSYSEGVLTTKPANIQNLQSIFKLTFTYNSSPISGIRSVQISSKDDKLFSSYNVITPSNNSISGAVIVTSTTDLSAVYVALRFDENPGDVINFKVVDKDGNVYQGSKTAPNGGFVNGNFYTSSVDVSPANLSALKAAINASGSDIAALRSSYECKYIDKDGNIKDTNEGATGIIAYLNNSDLIWAPASGTNNLETQTNIDFSGTRIFIVAITGFTETWDNLNTNGITSYYDVQRPSGSSVWFVPSNGQMNKYLGFANSISGVGKIIPSPSTGFYLSSSKATTNTQMRAYRTQYETWANKNKSETFDVLPCIAY